ncbi:hypothetical protein [Bradyrhizobium uaiense]|uniref:hypothetical protein n=1 Tax=Bradyrhizobium uaiense TaxID=2594946 RepID=UPI003D30F5F5
MAAIRSASAPISTALATLAAVRAVRSVFGTNGSIEVSATKSATGHLLGAASGAEAISTILAPRVQMAPDTNSR